MSMADEWFPVNKVMILSNEGWKNRIEITYSKWSLLSTPSQNIDTGKDLFIDNSKNS